MAVLQITVDLGDHGFETVRARLFAAQGAMEEAIDGILTLAFDEAGVPAVWSHTAYSVHRGHSGTQQESQSDQ